jgi:hypothetical protein
MWRGTITIGSWMAHGWFTGGSRVVHGCFARRPDEIWRGCVSLRVQHSLAGECRNHFEKRPLPELDRGARRILLFCDSVLDDSKPANTRSNFFSVAFEFRIQLFPGHHCFICNAACSRVLFIRRETLARDFNYAEYRLTMEFWSTK